jgi:hypothetical protein
LGPPLRTPRLGRHRFFLQHNAGGHDVTGGRRHLQQIVNRTCGREDDGSSTVVPRSNKSFWKGPWPWVIGGAVVVLALVFAGNSNGTGSVY